MYVELWTASTERPSVFGRFAQYKYLDSFRERDVEKTARNLLIENVSEETVARCTGLSPEKVSELAESVKCKT